MVLRRPAGNIPALAQNGCCGIQPLTLAVTILVACLSVYLYAKVPKGFFPQQDTGRLMGAVQAAQDISFQAMSGKMEQFVKIVMKIRRSTRWSGSRAEARRRTRAGFFVIAEAIGATRQCRTNISGNRCPERHGRRCNQSTAGETCSGFREQHCSCNRAGFDDRRGLGQRSTITPAKART